MVAERLVVLERLYPELPNIGGPATCLASAKALSLMIYKLQIMQICFGGLLDRLHIYPIMAQK